MWKFLKRFVPTRAQIMEKLIWIVRWADRRLPPGVRTLLGIPLIIGGILSFLPVLGIWMLPAGAALIVLDIPGWRRRMLAWIDKQEASLAAAASGAVTSDTPRPGEPSEKAD